MIVVCIIGVLASVAVPTYSRFINEARAGEGVSSLGSLFRLAVAYWEKPHSGQGLTAAGPGHCVAMDGFASQVAPPFPPVPYKRTADFSTLSIFRDLGFSRPDPSYFVIAGGGTADSGFPGALDVQCGSTQDALFAYGFAAACDLDGDGMIGGYSIIVAAQGGQLIRRRGFGDLADYFDATGVPACAFCSTGID